MATTANLPATPNLGLAQIAVGDTTTAKTVFTAGASGSKLVGLFATSTDTSTRDVVVNLVRASPSLTAQLTRITMTASAGDSNTIPVQNLLANVAIGLPIDNDGQPYLLLKSGDTITIAAAVTVTSGKFISAYAVGGDF